MTVSNEENPTNAEIVRRLVRIEDSVNNGKFVRKDVYEQKQESQDRDIKQLSDEQKWFRRGLIAAFGMIIVEISLVVLMVMLSVPVGVG